MKNFKNSILMWLVENSQHVFGYHGNHHFAWIIEPTHPYTYPTYLWSILFVVTEMERKMLKTMCFQKSASDRYVFNLFTNMVVSSHRHINAMFLRWHAFLCGFGSDVLFKIDHLRSISFFCQNAHHDWLTKECIIKLVSSVWIFVNKRLNN